MRPLLFNPDRNDVGLIFAATSDCQERFHIQKLLAQFASDELAELSRVAQAEAWATDQLDKETAGFWQHVATVYATATEIAHQREWAARDPKPTFGLDVKRVRDAADVVGLIGQHVTLRRAGRMFKGCCPFHSEHTASFMVYPEDGHWHCFGQCDTGGDIFDFYQRLRKIDFGQALRLVADEVGIRCQEPQPKRPASQKRQVTRL